MENDVLYNRIMNVIHEEYGEGSTAVANPEGEATGDLEKIQIGDEIYGISGGGGGGGTDRFFEVHLDQETYTLDKTWQQIFDAIADGKIPFYVYYSNESDFKYAILFQCGSAKQEENTFSVDFYNVSFAAGEPIIEGFPYTTDSANGYPAYED